MSNVTSRSELTTKEIVEQAIQDYHESILPYLNGMVPTIANKFDKANLYSTDEQIVGRWIDGKPLYQKTINFGALPNATSKSIAHNISGLDKLISVKANWFTSNSYYGDLSIAVIDGSPINFWADATKLFIQLEGNASSYSAYITLQYTKTTDEAIAIGSDTDYSLEEKIVGTWIDGKPLYQKVYANISLSNSADNVVDADFSHTIINYDIIPRGVTNTLTKFNKYTSENLLVRNGQLIEYIDYTGTWWAGWNTADIIVQYTKTID